MSQAVNVRSISLVSLGGVLGSLLRFLIGEIFTNSRTSTLIANLLGVGLATFLLVLVERRGSADLRHFLLPGFCAGLTTFSALALHALESSDGATGYISTTVIASLVIIAIVMPISRKVIAVRS
jgi:CrcB protein